MFKRKANRLSQFDYSSPNYYFVTVCTQHRMEHFGDIIEGKMNLNKQGLVVEKVWTEIPGHYLGILLDEFIVMPNHLHGIIIIPPLEEATGFHNMAASGRRYSLATIISAFKSISGKVIRQTNLVNFTWQKSFYDHVISKDESLNEIREYIRNNPLKWEMDKNILENIWM